MTATLRYAIYPSDATPEYANGAWGGSPVATGQEDPRATSGVQAWSSPAIGLAAATSYVVAFIWDNGTQASNMVVSEPFETLADIVFAFSLSIPSVTGIKATEAIPVVQIIYQ